jgi:hypothetical protein
MFVCNQRFFLILRRRVMRVMRGILDIARDMTKDLQPEPCL